MPNLRSKSAANRTWCFLVLLQVKCQTGSQQSLYGWAIMEPADYDILGLSQEKMKSFSIEQALCCIKKAYMKKALKYHPDKKS